MWPIIASIAGMIFSEKGPIGQFIKTKAETAQAEQTARLEMQKANIELIKQQGSDAVESEKNKLKATGEGFKFVTFVLINIPVIIVCFAPNRGKEIFENISLIPVWYAQLYVAIYCVIWGIPIAASAMSSIFGAVQTAWAMRQDKKIEKIQVMGEAQQIGKDAAKKEIFDTLKKATGLNGYTQQQVDMINPILDRVLASQGQAPVTVNQDNK